MYQVINLNIVSKGAVRKIQDHTSLFTMWYCVCFQDCSRLNE